MAQERLTQTPRTTQGKGPGVQAPWAGVSACFLTQHGQVLGGSVGLCLFIPHLATAHVTQHLLRASHSKHSTCIAPSTQPHSIARQRPRCPFRRLGHPAHIWYPRPADSRAAAHTRRPFLKARCSRSCLLPPTSSNHARGMPGNGQREKAKNQNNVQTLHCTERRRTHGGVGRQGRPPTERSSSSRDPQETALTRLLLGFRNMSRDNRRRLQVARLVSAEGPMPSLS